MQTLQTDSYNSSAKVYKVGRVAFINCVAGSYYCTAGAQIKDSASGTGWVISSGFRPVAQVEIKEALNGKRITIGTDGTVTCNEALSGINLRFSGCYITA